MATHAAPWDDEPTRPFTREETDTAVRLSRPASTLPPPACVCEGSRLAPSGARCHFCVGSDPPMSAA